MTRIKRMSTDFLFFSNRIERINRISFLFFYLLNPLNPLTTYFHSPLCPLPVGMSVSPGLKTLIFSDSAS
ncbi:MAG: hypothetical protein AB1414_03375, partial [bacterium]